MRLELETSHQPNLLGVSPITLFYHLGGWAGSRRGASGGRAHGGGLHAGTDVLHGTTAPRIGLQRRRRQPQLRDSGDGSHDFTNPAKVATTSRLGLQNRRTPQRTPAQTRQRRVPDSPRRGREGCCGRFFFFGC
ncbi:hypothetical protein TIFTF001_016375 [Ficus carica]|uniref:Uncharacterized protein n=1 Tax=Ficus carica TaxID=3494 RepID=A0AA88D642_FICCA|nr:hypothetical protein TIFTF001_016375 [Ficus carica]